MSSFHFLPHSLRVLPCSESGCLEEHFSSREEAQAHRDRVVESKLLGLSSVDPRTHDEELLRLQDSIVTALQELKGITSYISELYYNSLATKNELAEAREDLEALIKQELAPEPLARAQKALELLTSVAELKEQALVHENAYTGWARYYSGRGPHLHQDSACYRVWLAETASGFRARLQPAFSGYPLQALLADPRDLCSACFPLSRTTPAPISGPSCPASGTKDFVFTVAITGYAYGHLGDCPHCGQRVTVTKTGKLRKHRKPE